MSCPKVHRPWVSDKRVPTFVAEGADATPITSRKKSVLPVDLGRLQGCGSTTGPRRVIAPKLDSSHRNDKKQPWIGWYEANACVASSALLGNTART